MARVDTLKNFLTDIADKFREKLGITGAISHADFDTKIEEVYEAGYTKGQSVGGGGSGECNKHHLSDITDWRYFFAHGYRSDLLSVIDESDTSGGIQFEQVFYDCQLMTNVPKMDLSNGENFTAMFQTCASLKKIERMNTSKGYYFNNMFRSCTSLTEVLNIDMRNCESCNNMFRDCTALTTLTFATINNSDSTTGAFRVCDDYATAFHTATALTEESLVNLLNAFSDNTGLTTYTVTIGSTNLAKLTAEQKAIATNKNIKLA